MCFLGGEGTPEVVKQVVQRQHQQILAVKVHAPPACMVRRGAQHWHGEGVDVASGHQAAHGGRGCTPPPRHLRAGLHALELAAIRKVDISQGERLDGRLLVRRAAQHGAGEAEQ